VDLVKKGLDGRHKAQNYFTTLPLKQMMANFRTMASNFIIVCNVFNSKYRFKVLKCARLLLQSDPPGFHIRHQLGIK
jgi:hypothetical protein